MATVRGQCAECFRKIDADEQFCDQTCKDLYDRAWVSGVQATYKTEAESEAREHYETTGKIRSDEWIDRQTAKKLNRHLERHRPDLLKWRASIPSKP